MTEEFYARRVKNWCDMMNDYFAVTIRKAKTPEVMKMMREVNNNYYDSLFDNLQMMDLDRGIKEQYQDDLNVLYNSFDNIIDMMCSIREVAKSYE